MANRFKFRAWDKVKKIMIYGGSFHTLEMDGVLQEWFGFQTPHPDDCELMQSTGLTDKNGKEIFEGDVVEAKNFIGEVIGRYEIVWKHFGFSMRDPKNPEAQNYVSTRLIEVIGNVHEHPSLLK